MSAPLNPGRQIAWRFVKIQTLLVILTGLFASLFGGFLFMLSVLLGGGVGVIATAYVVYRGFQYQGARAAHDIARGFFVGQAYKVAISAVGLGLLFWSQKFVAAAVFIGYIATLAAYWCFPFLSGKASKK